MLRRLQKDVLKAMLPPRTEVLLFCRPTAVQGRMYEKLCRTATNLSMSTEALTTLTKLRKLCCHPDLLTEKSEGKTQHKMSSDASSDGPLVSMSGKLAILESLLLVIREEGEKVVIVSNFTSILSMIEATILRPKQFTFSRLDGSTEISERQALVDTFNRPTSSVFAFLLSSKAGGCGLNLIGGEYKLFLLNLVILFKVERLTHPIVPLILYEQPVGSSCSMQTGIRQPMLKLQPVSTGQVKPSLVSFTECSQRGPSRKVGLLCRLFMDCQSC